MSSSVGKSFFDLRTPAHDPLRLEERGYGIDALECLCVGAFPVPRKPIVVVEDEPSTVRNLPPAE
jgi:hypothetical protein